MFDLNAAMPYSTPLQAVLFILDMMVLNVPRPSQDIHLRVLPIKTAVQQLVAEELVGSSARDKYSLYELRMARDNLHAFRATLTTDISYLELDVEKVISRINRIMVKVQNASDRELMFEMRSSAGGALN